MVPMASKPRPLPRHRQFRQSHSPIHSIAGHTYPRLPVDWRLRTNRYLSRHGDRLGRIQCTDRCADHSHGNSCGSAPTRCRDAAPDTAYSTRTPAPAPPVHGPRTRSAAGPSAIAPPVCSHRSPRVACRDGRFRDSSAARSCWERRSGRSRWAGRRGRCIRCAAG